MLEPSCILQVGQGFPPPSCHRPFASSVRSLTHLAVLVDTVTLVMLLLAVLSAVASESPPGCDSSRCRSTGNDCCPPVCDICNGGLLRANITAGYTANVSYTCQEAQDFARDEGVQKCSEFQACRWLYRVRVWVSLSGRVSAVRAPLAPAPQPEPYDSHSHL